MKLCRIFVGLILGVLLIRIGIHHFTNPDTYDRIVPDYLGAPRFWTLSSGCIEIILGTGLIFNRSRKIASRALVIFFIAVYLANINMWINDVPFSGTHLTSRGHVVRLIIQLVLIAIAFNLSEINLRLSKKR